MPRKSLNRWSLRGWPAALLGAALMSPACADNSEEYLYYT